MNRQHILDTAASLFEENSVSQVSMKQIAVECQIGQGTLYRHFSSKADICQTLMDNEIENMFKTIDQIKQTDDPIELKIKYILYAFVQLINDNKQKLEEMKSAGNRNKVMMHLHFYQQLKQEIQSYIERLDIVNDAEFHTDIMLNSFSRDVFDYHCVEKKVLPETFAERIYFVFIERLMNTSDKQF